MVILKALLRKAFKITLQVVSLTWRLYKRSKQVRENRLRLQLPPMIVKAFLVRELEMSDGDLSA